MLSRGDRKINLVSLYGRFERRQGRRQGGIAQVPAAVGIDGHERHVVAGWVERAQDRSRRDEGNLVFDRASTEEQSDPEFGHRSPPVPVRQA